MRGLLPSANEELLKPPPERIGDCDGRIARWQALAADDPRNVDVMTRRLAARDSADACARDWRNNHPPPAEKRRRDARGMVTAGAMLLGIGGSFATGIGGYAIGVGATSDRDSWSHPFGVVILLNAGLAGVLTIAGTVLLSVGGARLRR
jgi:hypothetical protein